jgi:hypothetical protein
MLLRRVHIPQEVLLSNPEDQSLISEMTGTPRDRARLQHELLQKEVDLLRARLDITRSQLGVVARSGVRWAHASARSQLGPYPWLKFAVLAASSYLVTTAIRRLPLGSITAAALPVVAAVMKRRM